MYLLYMKGFEILKNLRYAFDIFNFPHVDILARYAKFDNHLFWGLIPHISQLLDGCG